MKHYCCSWECDAWRRRQAEPPGPGYRLLVKAVSLSGWCWQWLLPDLCYSSLTVVVWLIPGSGRVTFNNQRSYLKAVTAAFVEIKTTKFTKKVSEAAQGGSCVMGGTAESTSVYGACPISLLKR